MELRDLIGKAKDYLPEEKLGIIEEAYRFALKAHEGQFRQSGEPYLEHPLETAMVIADLQLDAHCIAAALLHDVLENCGVPLSEVEAKFGSEVGGLVDGTTKLGKIAEPAKGARSRRGSDDSEAQAENLRKMLMAMAEDVRVVFIKLADRLHNMRTLSALPSQKRQNIAQETMEIYVPLAHRLGIWQLKWQLEDLSFHHLQPQKYRQIARLLDTRRAPRERYIAQVIAILERELEKAGLRAEITGRPKNIYSIYTKTERYANQGKEFSEIYDLIALRVLVDEVQDCYSALGVIHSLWRPLPGQFDDHIANPKRNMYQSLHTTVMCLDAKPLEIQIRTREMHRVAEYGIAAHWRYKEGAKGDMRFDEKIAWLRQLIEWQRELRGADFLESVKTDIFHDQVFVYTPKGDIKDLPTGSTPLDFAYRIHTDLGHRCIGAKVNGRLVPLNYQVRNGDTIEILSTKADRGPSRDWLNPSLAYLKTSHAKEKARQWFRKQEREENIERGKELLERELRRLGMSLSGQEKIAHLFKYEEFDEFLCAIGCGDINTHQIAVKLAGEERSQVLPQAPPKLQPVSAAVQVLGVGDLLTHIARCCNPMPGDEIIGYVTRTRGVTVHRKDCPSIINEEEKERLVRVDWGRSPRLFPVAIRIEAWDRVGLLRDISTVISSGERVNMVRVSSVEHDDGTVTISATLEVTGIGQLSRLLSKLEGVRGLISVARSVEEARQED